MIRASLSDRRSNARSCCRWLITNSGGGGDRRLKRRLPTTISTSSIKSSHYNALSKFDHRRRSTLSIPVLKNGFHRTTAAASSSMSTKPAYDYSEHDNDEDDADGDRILGTDDDDSDHQLRWIKRSSGLDSLSQYAEGGNDFSEEESLLNLLNDDKDMNRTHDVRRRKKLPEDTFGGDEDSLLHLLNDSANVNTDRAAHKANQSEEHSGEEPSLFHLLNDSKNMDRDTVEDYSEPENGTKDDASLLRLLNRGNVQDYIEPSTQTSYDHEDNNDQNEEGGSLMDLLNGTNESESSLSTGLNGYNMPLQFQPPDVLEEDTAKPLHELLNEESKDIRKNAKYKELNRLQLQLEVESTEEAIRKRLDVWNAARDRSTGYDTIPAVRRALDSWYGPLTEAIELEQWLYLNGDTKTCSYNTLLDDIAKSDDDTQIDGESSSLRRAVKDRSVYGPLLCLLPPQKIAVLLAHTALSFAISDKQGQFKVVSLALCIAQALETEVNVSRALRVRAKERKLRLTSLKDEDGIDDVTKDNDGANGAQREIPDDDEREAVADSEGIAIDKWVYTATHLQRFLGELQGGGFGDQKSLKGKGRVRPAIVKKRCKEILLSEGFVPEGACSESEEGVDENGQLSANDFAEWDPVKKVKLGASLIRLLLDYTSFSPPLERGRDGPPEPAFRYLRKSARRGKAYGCISLHPDLLDIAVKEEFSSTTMFVSPTMGSDRVQPMVVPPKDWTSVDNGGYEVIKVPFMRTRHCRTQKDSIHRADLSKVMEGLNVLGKIPWKVNEKVLDTALKCWEDGIVLGDIPSQVNFEVPPLPESLEYKDYKTLGDFEQKVHLDAYRKYREALTKHNRFKQKNMDLHSLRCSAILKLNQAKKFRDFEEIFFPYNVDFRGRAYPVTPHLSIVGSDLCRGLLMFAQPKPLGKNGLYWLKVHLANLAGADKMSFDGRAQFADENMESIRAAVHHPFGTNDWWTKFDDPFQGLATCHEIVQAIDSGDHENYLCCLPVHMDGSCNGLQHYAALGRDRGGGKAVNLCVADKPQDVYIGVMHEVVKRVAQDAEEMIPFDENKSDLTRAEKDFLKKTKSAQLVNGLIDRGVVKRTVMTSVYGVTYIGAKNQISEKIEEKLEGKGYDIDEIEPQIHMACGYLASLTMEVMGQQFKGARETMNWLTKCARLIAAQGQPVSFISPIGVPVVQPYRQSRPFTVVTLLQNITLTNDSDVLPLHRQRQVSAFPPNYVHSLDSSHMLLTAIEMQKRDLYFSAVHDSYWTHPCDIEEMNVVLRESFVDLYDHPLLEELKQTWEMRYPSITFPDIPTQGDLDLNEVRSAPYFFQ